MRKTIALLLVLLQTVLLIAESEKDSPAPGLPVSAPIEDNNIIPPAREASEYSRLCLEKDIIGFWKLIKWNKYFHIPAGDWKKPAFRNFQWYIFTKDGKIKSFSATKDYKDSEVWVKLLKVDSALRYRFDRKGILQITNIKKKEVNELWRCALVTEDIVSEKYGIKLRKGDVLQSLIGKDNHILYVRQMRKINGVEN